MPPNEKNRIIGGIDIKGVSDESLPATPQSPFNTKETIDHSGVSFSELEREKGTPSSSPQHQSAIRTLQGDIAETIRDKQVSLADMALAEKKRSISREEKAAGTNISGKRAPSFTNIVIVALGILLIMGAGAAVFLVAYQQGGITPEEEETFEKQTPIPVTAQKKLLVTATTREQFLSFVEESIASIPISTGAITDLYLVREEETSSGAETTEGGSEEVAFETSELFETLRTQSPGRLSRSLDENFMFGVLTTDAVHPFLIFNVTSFESAFASMLEWEDAIASDLPFLIPPQPPALPALLPEPSTDQSATGTATSAPEVTPEPIILRPRPAFKDIIVKNRDTRALVDENGDISLIYSFPTRELLIITDSKETLEEIFNQFEQLQLRG